jgi:hypothetical protein
MVAGLLLLVLFVLLREPNTKAIVIPSGTWEPAEYGDKPYELQDVVDPDAAFRLHLVFNDEVCDLEAPPGSEIHGVVQEVLQGRFRSYTDSYGFALRWTHHREHSIDVFQSDTKVLRFGAGPIFAVKRKDGATMELCRQEDHDYTKAYFPRLIHSLHRFTGFPSAYRGWPPDSPNESKPTTRGASK